MSIELHRGTWWPKYDTHCRNLFPKQLGDMDKAISLCMKRRGVIQAGGNVGLWPLKLSKHFEWCWTFEPDKTNYECMELNLKDTDNVSMIPAAIGEKEEQVQLVLGKNPHNCGALNIEQSPGNTSVIPLDSIFIEIHQPIDLIILDVEGYELYAFKGARRIISTFTPIIQFEDKGMSDKYGISKGDAVQYLKEEHGYEQAATVGRDVICVP